MGRMNSLEIKGTRRLNPTRAIMKTFSQSYINAVARANTRKPGHTENGSASQALNKLKGN